MCDECSLLLFNDSNKKDTMRPEITATDAQGIVSELELQGYGWDIGNTNNFTECRVWKWPHVVGRHRPIKQETMTEMLISAIANMDES